MTIVVAGVLGFCVKQEYKYISKSHLDWQWHAFSIYLVSNVWNCRSHCSRGVRRRSAAARLLRSWVWIPLGAWMFVCCECCVLSGRGLCDELITCPEESYRLWCVVVCDLENLKNEEAMNRVGSQRHRKKRYAIILRVKGQHVKLPIHIHIASRLRMNQFIHPLFSYCIILLHRSGFNGKQNVVAYFKVIFLL
jgi:hypothetical protein